MLSNKSGGEVFVGVSSCCLETGWSSCEGWQMITFAPLLWHTASYQLPTRLHIIVLHPLGPVIQLVFFSVYFAVCSLGSYCTSLPIRI